MESNAWLTGTAVQLPVNEKFLLHVFQPHSCIPHDDDAPKSAMSFLIGAALP